ncbi:hypothetical protein RMCBS344292_07366 [Rhizopus microsporus]|nr:hypothetical protein RMCBS344292_07366 [Rhizopus microsporus]
MDSLVHKASEELGERLSVGSVTKSVMDSFTFQINDSLKRMKETEELTSKVQKETESIHDMLSILKNKNEEMLTAFKQIDQLEIIVNRVKDTYNAVAKNMDQIERAISASTSTFGLGKKRSTTVQPYFPPPDHVDIYNTDELFNSLSSSK